MIKGTLLSKKNAIAIGKVALLVGLGLASTGAFAANGDELGNGICKLVSILTGKYLFGFAILATFGGMMGVIFGGEMTDGLKKVATVVSIVGITLAAGGILSFAFSAFGGMAC